MEAYFNVVSKRKQDDKNITVSKSTDVKGESQTPTNLRRVASSVKIREESVADLNGHESTSTQKGRVKAYANEVPCPLDVTKMLLSSLSDPSNPITHSNIADRTGENNTVESLLRQKIAYSALSRPLCGICDWSPGCRRTREPTTVPRTSRRETA